MAASLNTQLADALTERQVQAGRAETRQRLALWGWLAVLEADILAILSRQDPTALGLLAWRRRRVQTVLEEELAPLVTARYRQMEAETTTFLLSLAQQEAAAVRALVNILSESLAVAVAISLPPLRQMITHAPFPSGTTPSAQSTTGPQWWTRLGESLLQRLGDQWLMSVSLEEDLQALRARVQGTSALGFTDGLMAWAKTEAARLLRTAVTHAVSSARVVLAELQPEGGLVLEHSSILDMRTSTICQVRDGLRFTVEAPHEPIGHTIPFLLGPPYHPNCRSTILTLLEEGGAVAGGGFEAFLRRQSVSRQRELLGPGRWELWQQQKLGLRDLLDSATGRSLTLEELVT
jgi:hypothetical protein